MQKRWFGVDGKPCEFAETSWGNGVKGVIRTLTGAGELNTERLNYFANLIGEAIDTGEAEEQPWSQAAGRERSEKQLDDIIKIITNLLDAVDQLNRPAVDALAAEGEHPNQFRGRLRDFRLAACDARTMLENAPPVKGAPKKHQAEAISLVAKEIYEEVTGKPVGHTVNPDGGERTGPFIDFLNALYNVCSIKASAQAQVKKL
ncbi:hypothetical protein NHF45_06945 [Maricaulaceae bacterium NA33B04]|nr:hypothetical protein [Maricaulaceae bacterium NA33B04]